MSEPAYEAWERDDYVHRTVVLPAALAERLAAEAERRDIATAGAATGTTRGDPAARPRAVRRPEVVGLDAAGLGVFA